MNHPKHELQVLRSAIDLLSEAEEELSVNLDREIQKLQAKLSRRTLQKEEK